MSRIHRRPTLAAFAILALAFAGRAHALEPFKSYDTFNAAPISPLRWVDGERSRSIKGGMLNLVQRSYGSNAADTGYTPYTWNENLLDAATVTELRAKITVNALEVNPCAANATVGNSRARLLLTGFNSGTPTPGSEVGDVMAQVRAIRFANSTDPAGVLQVQANLFTCTVADCSSSTLIGTTQSLGTLTFPGATTLTIQWDKANHQVKYSRDAGAFTATIPYTGTDSVPAAVPVAQLSTREEIASCTAGRVTGYVDASFDNVQVNQSAQP